MTSAAKKTARPTAAAPRVIVSRGLGARAAAPTAPVPTLTIRIIKPSAAGAAAKATKKTQRGFWSFLFPQPSSSLNVASGNVFARAGNAPAAAACIANPFVLSAAHQIGALRAEEAVPLKEKSRLKTGFVALSSFSFGLAASLGVKSFVPAISLKFAVAGALMFTSLAGTAALPVIAALITATTLGATAGAVSHLVRGGVQALMGQETKPDFWTKALAKSFGFGALGGLTGGLITHWGEATQFVSEFSPQTGALMKTTGEAVKSGLGAAKEWVLEKVPAIFQGIKEDLHAVGGWFRRTLGPLVGLNPQEGALNFSEPPAVTVKPPSMTESLKELTPPPVADAFDPPMATPVPQGDFHVLSAYGTPDTTGGMIPTALPSVAFPGEEVLLVPSDFELPPVDGVAPSPTGLFEAAMPAMPTEVPALFGKLLSRGSFNFLPEDMRQTALAMAKAKHVAPAALMSYCADVSYYLLNKVPAQSAELQKSAYNMMRKAVEISGAQGWTGTKYGKMLCANLSYMWRTGIGTTRNLDSASFYALLAQGTSLGDKALSLLKKAVPDAVKKVAEKMPLLQALSGLGL